MFYDTVLFDADMTLLDFDTDEKNAFNGVMHNHGITGHGIYQMYHEINIGFWKSYEKGEIPKSAIGPGRFGLLTERLGIDLDGKLLNDEYMLLLSEGGVLMDGAELLCKQLCENGFSLYIITNGTEFIQKKRLKKSGLNRYVKGVFISDVIGYPKPKKEYFDAVLSELEQRDKSKIIIVGDSLTSDIQGGINCGIDTCLFAPESIPVSHQIKPTYTVRSFAELYTLLNK